MTNLYPNPHDNLKEGNNNMSTITLDEVLDLLADKVAARINGTPAEKAASNGKGKSKAKAEPEPETDDEADEDDPQAERRAELKRKRIDSLRKIAIDLGFPKKDVNATTDKDVLIESILADEAESGDEPEDEPDEDEADEAEDEADDEDADEDEDDESDEEDEDEDSEDEEEGYDRETLEGMNLRELKVVAKEAGYSTADIKGLDQDGLVDFLLGEDAEEGDDDEDEEEAEDEGDEYTEEELLAMKPAELRALAKEWGIKVPPTAKTAKAIVKHLV